jgi:hypothetical protein
LTLAHQNNLKTPKNNFNLRQKKLFFFKNTFEIKKQISS